MKRTCSSLRGSWVALLASALLGTAAAQWSADPSVNLVVTDRASDQSQSKLAATRDGGVFVSWLDGGASGWDVRIQRLSPTGLGSFPSDGLLVADRSFSSTQDYGLDLSSTDDALVAFRDDRPGGVQVTATKVTSTGAQPWGAGGVALTNTSAFVANPKIAGTSDGGAVVAWTQDSSVMVQKLDSGGVPLWGQGITLTPSVGSYFTADLQAEENEAVLSLVHQTGGFSAPRHLHAQKFDESGQGLWGPSPLAVFDGGSLQFGNFPEFTMDGAGGAVFSWYSSSPSLQCFAQRVSAAGVEAWAHDGVALATTPGNLRVNPSVAFHVALDEVYATWMELNSSQSQRGVRAQRLSAAGARLWTDDGVELVALGSADIGPGRAMVEESNGGVLVAWPEAQSFGTDQLYGAHVDTGGAIDVGRFDVASAPSGKSRLQGAVSAAGFGVFCWKDERSDGGDIYAQNVRFDGTLGNRPSIGTNYCAPAVNSTGLPGQIGALGRDGAAEDDVVLVASELPTDSFGFFLASRDSGFVVGPGGSFGNLCLGGAIGRYVGPGQTLNSGVPGAFSLALRLPMTPQPTGLVPVAPGETWYFQAWHRDSVAGASGSNFTNALEITFL